MLKENCIILVFFSLMNKDLGVKPLNKSMVIVHHIPGIFFFGQIDLLKGWFSRLKFGKSMLNFKKFE